jgi:hypothetical protein
VDDLILINDQVISAHVTGPMRSGFINELKNMVDASTPMPQKFNKLVKNVVANVDINI